MCKHICKCGAEWSHQDIAANMLTQNVGVFLPCPYPQLHLADGSKYMGHTQLCPKCHESWKRTHNNNGHKLSIKEVIEKMDKEQKSGKLSAPRIIEIQLDEEARFKLMIDKISTGDMTLDELEAHYNDILEKMESFRVRALRFRQLKVDWDIEQMSQHTDEERAEFELLKQKKAVEKRQSTSVETVRRNKTEKMIESFAQKIMASNPALSHEQAIERAKLMFA